MHFATAAMVVECPLSLRRIETFRRLNHQCVIKEVIPEIPTGVRAMQSYISFIPNSLLRQADYFQLFFIATRVPAQRQCRPVQD